MLHLHFAAPTGKLAQCARYMKGYGHDHFFLRVDLVVARFAVDIDLPRVEVRSGALGREAAAGLEDWSSITALRTQTIDGRPSRIFCQLFPSSVDPKS